MPARAPRQPVGETGSFYQPGGGASTTADAPRLAAFYRTVLVLDPAGDDAHTSFPTPGAELAIFTVQSMESMAPGSTEGMGTGHRR